MACSAHRWQTESKAAWINRGMLCKRNRDEPPRNAAALCTRRRGGCKHETPFGSGKKMVRFELSSSICSFTCSSSHSSNTDRHGFEFSKRARKELARHSSRQS